MTSTQFVEGADKQVQNPDAELGHDRLSSFHRLPPEMLLQIFAFLDGIDQVCLALTCKYLFSTGTFVSLKPIKALGVHGTYQELIVRLKPEMPDNYRLCEKCWKFKDMIVANKPKGSTGPASKTPRQTKNGFIVCCKCLWKQDKEQEKTQKAVTQLKATIARL